MKVLFMYILPSGGMNTLNRVRARALRGAGIESHLLFLRTGSGMGDIEPDIPVFYAAEPQAIGQILHAHAYDAVIVTSAYSYLPVLRGLGYTGKLIFENNGFGPPDQARQAMLDAKPHVDPCADALMYPGTRHIGDILRSLYPNKPIFSVFNPVDPAMFGYLPSRNNPVRPVLAWVGRLEPNKNWRDFLRIGAEVAKLLPRVHLWMFTDPELAWPGETEAMERLTAELGLAGRITHYTRIPHRLMPDYLSRVADSGGALVITSVAESFAYTAPEAILCRCPVVTTDSDGVRAVIENETTGLFYPHGDFAAGARQVMRVLTQPALRARLVAAGAQRIRTNLSPQRFAGLFAQMLQILGIGR